MDIEKLKKLVRKKASSKIKGGKVHINYDENDIFDLAKEIYNLAIKEAAQNANCYYNGKNMQWEVDDEEILKLKL